MATEYEQMATDDISAKDIGFVLTELFRNKNNDISMFAARLSEKVPVKTIQKIIENAQKFYKSNEMSDAGYYDLSATKVQTIFAAAQDYYKADAEKNNFNLDGRLGESFTEREKQNFQNGSFEKISFAERVQRAKTDFSTDMKKAHDEFDKSNKNLDSYDIFNKNVISAWNRASGRVCNPEYQHGHSHDQIFADYQSGLGKIYTQVCTTNYAKLSPEVKMQWDETCTVRDQWHAYHDARMAGDKSAKEPETPMKPYPKRTNEQEANEYYSNAESFEQIATLSIEQLREREKKIYGDTYQSSPHSNKTDADFKKQHEYFKAWAVRYRREADMYMGIAKENPNQPIKDKTRGINLFDKPYDEPETVVTATQSAANTKQSTPVKEPPEQLRREEVGK